MGKGGLDSEGPGESVVTRCSVSQADHREFYSPLGSTVSLVEWVCSKFHSVLTIIPSLVIKGRWWNSPIHISSIIPNKD